VLLSARADAQDVEALRPFHGRNVVAVEIAGHVVTREEVIRRELRTLAGEPLDLVTVAADLRRLDNLAIFAEVHASADEGAGGLRVTFAVKELPSWIPLLALLYTEENGFSAGPGVSFLNLAGRDISMSARAYFGGTEQFWGRLSWPWIAADHVSLDAYAAHLERQDEVRDFTERSDELTPRLGFYLGERGRASAALSFFHMSSDVPGQTLDPDNDDLLVRVGGRLGWDSRDSWNNPSAGWQNELELWYTGLGGDGDFWSLNLDLRRYLAPARRQRLLLSQLLSLQSGTLGTDVPLYLDYRLGGANSIRGYGVELGETLHGKNQWLGTAEYSFNLMAPRRFNVSKFALRLGVDLALFADAGIAWSEDRELALARARGGLGAGLRLLIPGTEMVRLDVGWSPTGDFHFHFASGARPAAQRQRLR
jgi:outer membrane protein assembly factor BamA